MKKYKKILLYDFAENKGFIERLKQFADDVKLVTTNDDYQDGLTKNDFEGVDVFITNAFDNFHNDFFEDSNVTDIFTMFTDTSMFDEDYLRSLGIKIHNISGQATQGVAEFSLSVLLNSYRHTAKAEEFSKNGGEGFFDFKGREIFGKQVGIIGIGNIGKHFKYIMEGLGATVEYYSKSTQTKTSEEIFQISDIIFISYPLKKGCEGEYGKEALKGCKEGTIILNPSRIEHFQLDELYEFLLDRKDVIFWQDESVNDTWKQYKERFLSLDNFLITPHCAFYTEENPQRVQELVLDNISNS